MANANNSIRSGGTLVHGRRDGKSDVSLSAIQAVAVELDVQFPQLITAEDGTWGFGTTGFGDVSVHLINNHIEPLLEGENALATEKLCNMIMYIVSPCYPSDLAAFAMSAVDLALRDFKGRLL